MPKHNNSFSTSISTSDAMKHLQSYYNAVREIYRASRHIPSGTSEHSYRAPLSNLLDLFGMDAIAEIRHSNSLVADKSSDSKSVKFYNRPDYSVYNSNSLLQGLIETKDLDERLDSMISDKNLNSQLNKYRRTHRNIILTDYMEFVLLGDSETSLHEVRLFRLCDLDTSAIKISSDIAKSFITLLSSFNNAEPVAPSTDEDLAYRMGDIARGVHETLYTIAMRDLVNNRESDSESSVLLGLYDQYNSINSPETVEQMHGKSGIQTDMMTPELRDFLKNYAQMLVYVIFYAGMNSTGDLTLDTVRSNIPGNIDVMKRLLGKTVDLWDDGSHEGKRLSRHLSYMVAMMNAMDREDMQRKLSFATQHSGNDPYIYLFEGFLKHFDVDIRKQRGVYYTPFEAVNFMVSSTDYLLRTKLGVPKGLADRNTKVLDFATGTGTFMLEVVRNILDRTTDEAKRMEMIESHILPNVYGFELLLSPFITAHLRINQYMREVCPSYSPSSSDRLQIYLGNTLSDSSHSIANEAMKNNHTNLYAKELKGTDDIKNHETKVQVVIGNPPYNAKSQNKGRTITDLMTSTYAPIGEVKSAVNDDYVKFIRFSHNLMMKNGGKGVVSVITNNSFMEAPTFNRMRQSLMTDFQEIYVLNIHGASKAKTMTTTTKSLQGGEPDENIFSITVGIAITFLLKTNTTKNRSASDCKVYRADMSGSSQGKLLRLLGGATDITESMTSKGASASKQVWDSMGWAQVSPTSLNKFRFLQEDTSLLSKWEAGYKLDDVFGNHNSGVITQNDAMAIAFTKEQLQARLTTFASMTPTDARSHFGIKEDSRDWVLARAHNDVLTNGIKCIQPIHYRPFDMRNVYYTGKRGKGFVSYQLLSTMKHILGVKENLGLVVSRDSKTASHICFVVNGLIERQIIKNATIYPMMLMNEGTLTKDDSVTGNLASLKDAGGNVTSRTLLTDLAERYADQSMKDADIFHMSNLFGYIYGLFNHAGYLSTFAEPISKGKPNLFFPADKATYNAMVKFGRVLILRHTMETRWLSNYERSIGNINAKVELKPNSKNDAGYCHKTHVLYYYRSEKFNKHSKEITEAVSAVMMDMVPTYRDPDFAGYTQYSNGDIPLTVDIDRVTAAILSVTAHLDNVSNRLTSSDFAGFCAVIPEVSTYSVGNVSVFGSYLQDRSGTKGEKNGHNCTLSLNEREHLDRVITSLEHTVQIKHELASIDLDFL